MGGLHRKRTGFKGGNQEGMTKIKEHLGVRWKSNIAETF